MRLGKSSCLPPAFWSVLLFASFSAYGAGAASERQLGPDRLYNPYASRSSSESEIPAVIRDAIEFSVGSGRQVSVDPRIVGGTPAPLRAYPWQVSIGIKGIDNKLSHFCGGSVIGPDWVLTAAHCVYGQTAPENLQVLSGTNYLNDPGQISLVSKIVLHEDWSPTDYSNDIAVLKLAAPIGEVPIGLLSPEAASNLSRPGLIAIVSGWGLTREDGRVSNVLRNVSVQIVSKSDCTGAAAYGDSITESMFCAGFAEGGKDSCQGDSGGPLMVPDGRGRLILAGIVSWGEGCSRPGKYGVYTLVPLFSDWIARVMAKGD
ncbi:serine protease [Methylobacterium soli]|uniref:Serine protease n=1 Tax=Methylobacterium soli TaxID=553447 RepID=A0A6L3SNU8_9HYPH|nr:serine protease [Methylobacterium soli]GJE44312.1 hypothetical protein AEGHOMDF_3500 [Methylobacterium soli]